MEEANEETGWKLVHGDVLRPPTSYPMLFAVRLSMPEVIDACHLSPGDRPDPLETSLFLACFFVQWLNGEFNGTGSIPKTTIQHQRKHNPVEALATVRAAS